MRIDKASSSPIELITVSRKFNNTDFLKPNYYHAIRWDPSGDCPPGFIAQRIKRDTKFSYGRLSAAAVGATRPTHTWTWLPEIKTEAEYWEIWEVVVIDKSPHEAAAIPHLTQSAHVRLGLKRVRIYPGIIADAMTARYATSWGERSGSALSADTADQYKRPATDPADLDYWAHDTFTETRPKPLKPIKGTFKIKGVAYFLPSGDRAAENWMTQYLRTAQRDYKAAGGYTGGALWQNPGRLAAPDAKYKVMTRYEAGLFHHVKQSDVTPPGGPATIVNLPDVKDEWKDREYPVGLLR